MVLEEVTNDENRVFQLAEEFVTHTGRCVFLTGKAGTGKTTFLRHVKNNTKKNTVIIAPTGVAAINAGGTTIHSFFQLPFSPFIPETEPSGTGSLFDNFGLLQNLRIDTEKRNVLRQLELLIIDEVSMVRCDVLDAIDIILRFFRKKEHIPFGGVQVLLIGDLYQLPPVVQQEEWSLLGKYYRSPFFFDAQVMQHVNPVYIELRKIYRQSDKEFIELLNRIRNNETGDYEMKLLNSRYQPDFRPEEKDGYITLTSHNHKADKINYDALSRLPGEPVSFEGDVEGDFPERSFPTDKKLSLKEGAQVMFIKNDMERIRRYYNGKIGTVKKIRNGTIVVAFPGEENELEVNKDTWRNVRYTYNPVSRQVEEEVLGTFTQYAIRLAWAITIHKSQGLTFEKVIIDAGSSFAPGQVYVALSRCTSLSGIILYSRIFRNAIRSDERVITYSREEKTPEQLTPILELEQRQYKLSSLLSIFEWDIAIEETSLLREYLAQRKFVDQDKAAEVLDRMDQTLLEQKRITQKFSAQLLNGIQNPSYLISRVDAGVDYFCGIIDENLVAPLKAFDQELGKAKRVKKARRKIKDLVEFYTAFKGYFEKARRLASTWEEG